MAAVADDLAPVVLKLQVPSLALPIAHVPLQGLLVLNDLLDVFLNLLSILLFADAAVVILSHFLEALHLLRVIFPINVQVLLQDLFNFGVS